MAADKNRFLQRAEWHDYHSKSIYMLTLMKSSSIPAFSAVSDYHGRLFNNSGSQVNSFSGSPANSFSGSQVNSFSGSPVNSFSGCADGISSASDRCHKIRPLVTLSPVGAAIEREFASWVAEFPMLRILISCLMPDHLHILLYVTTSTDKHLSDIVKVLKWNCNRAVKSLVGSDQSVVVFEPGYNDRIVTRAGQKDIFYNYIQDNPRRLLARRMFPEFFCSTKILKICGQKVSLYGNLFLLNHPQKMQVRYSRKFTEAELTHREKGYLEIMRAGGVLVSPFIHREEKRIKEMAVEKGGSLIQIVTNGFPPRFKPSGRDFELCASGRLLLVGPVEFRTRRKSLERNEAMWGNAIASEIVALIGKIV